MTKSKVDTINLDLPLAHMPPYIHPTHRKRALSLVPRKEERQYQDTNPNSEAVAGCVTPAHCNLPNTSYIWCQRSQSKSNTNIFRGVPLQVGDVLPQGVAKTTQLRSPFVRPVQTNKKTKKGQQKHVYLSVESKHRRE